MVKKRKGKNRNYRIEVVASQEDGFYYGSTTIFERSTTYRKYILTKLKEINDSYEPEPFLKFNLFIDDNKEGVFDSINDIMNFIKKEIKE